MWLFKMSPLFAGSCTNLDVTLKLETYSKHFTNIKIEVYVQHSKDLLRVRWLLYPK